MFKLKGVIPPMITPFKENGELDEQGLRQLVEFLNGKVDGLFICGSYGCGPLMSLAERKRVAEIVKETATPETIIIVHTGCASTWETIELTLHAKEIGCHAAAAVAPYYFKHNDKNLLNHYTQILEAVKDFPFYIYHNPGFSGYELSDKVIKELKDKGLTGIKDATFNIMKHATYHREFVDENFDVALGTEAMWVSAHAVGCEAFIPGIGNVFPDLCRKMYRQSMDGDQDAALKTQFQINRLRDIMYIADSTQLAIYAMAEIRGIVKAYPRAPFVPANEEQKARIRNALIAEGLL